ncbi:MAG TPA: hypothetical protein VH351_06880 [Bryobacteraceae bacterium]|jgi:hypothetical protein|nr:hypothetical protein [Bryobacteraceae bacterium]
MRNHPRTTPTNSDNVTAAAYLLVLGLMCRPTAKSWPSSPRFGLMAFAEVSLLRLVLTVDWAAESTEIASNDLGDSVRALRHPSNSDLNANTDGRLVCR